MTRSIIATGEAHGPTDAGVRGGLLALCLMLTIVGPVISFWIVAEEFAALVPAFASPAARWATIVSIAATTGSVAFGIQAGLRLWAIRPHAVRIAKASLLVALAVDILTTAISTSLLATPPDGDAWFYDVLIDLVPSLLFFTVCYAYLNRSRRVAATYTSS